MQKLIWHLWELNGWPNWCIIYNQRLLTSYWLLMVLVELWCYPPRIHACEVGLHSRLLQPSNKSKEFSSTLRRVRIYTKPGSRGMVFKLFYGTLENITFNLGLWRWGGKDEVLNLESITHRFWGCPRARKAWEFAFTWLYKLKQHLEPSCA